MLENTNDYMAVLMAVMALATVLIFAAKMFSLRLTAKHLQEEAEYYSKDHQEGKFYVSQSHKTK